MSGMEAIGAANGIASLFKTTVEWFEYVYVARNTWQTVQTELLKLDNAQLRLTRWGKAVGLSGFQITDDDSLRATGDFVLNEEQENKAKQTFTLISQKFKACQKICIAYRKGKKEDDPAVVETEIKPFGPNWNPMRRYLHDSMRELVEGRKNKVSVARKAKFAIYDRAHLEKLVKDINDAIDALEKIYPPPPDKQGDLSKEEIENLVGVLKELNGAIKDRDPLLGSAVQTILNQKVSHLPNLLVKFAHNIQEQHEDL